jgi:putative glutamine amidotransferase
MAASGRPVLGIICDRRKSGTEFAQTVMERYVASAMKHADCAALLIPSLPELMQASEVVGRLDGVLLTGSPSNVGPGRYGDALNNPPGPLDEFRDEMTLRLIDTALENKRPVFGICRGFQELNVAFGGTLRRDVSEDGRSLEHHSKIDVAFDEMFDHEHAVELVPGGVLSRAYYREELLVNSVHYQGADKIGEGLKVEARAPDGLVEAFSARVNSAPVLAVQWHPEWRTDQQSDSQTFFQLLGRALRGERLEGF